MPVTARLTVLCALPISLPLLVTVIPATVPEPDSANVASATSASIFAVPFMWRSFHCFVSLPRLCVASVFGIRCEFTDAVTVTSSVVAPPMVALPVATSAWVVVSQEGGAHIIGPDEICFGSSTRATVTVSPDSVTRPVETVMEFALAEVTACVAGATVDPLVAEVDPWILTLSPILKFWNKSPDDAEIVPVLVPVFVNVSALDWNPFISTSSTLDPISRSISSSVV